MNKYYLFKIKKDYCCSNLYDIFDSIRRSNIKHISTSFSFYKCITDFISDDEKKKICQFLKQNPNYQCSNKVHKYFDYYNNEKSYVKFHNNYICILTNYRKSKIFDFLVSLENYFLCDFSLKNGMLLSKTALVFE